MRSYAHGGRSGKSVLNDVDESSALAETELHSAVGSGEQCVVTTTADVATCVELGSSLPDNDGSGWEFLAVEGLHAEPLAP